MPSIDPVLVVTIPEGKGEIAFATTEELDAWVKQQEEFYTWVFSIGSGAPAVAQLRSQWKQFRNQIVNVRGQLISTPNDGGVVSKAKADIEGAMRGALSIVLAESAEARFLRKSIPGNPRSVAYALAHLRSAPSSDEGADSVLGTVLANEFRKGSSEATVEQRIQLEELISRASADLAGRTAEWALLVNNANSANEIVRESQKTFEKNDVERIKVSDDQFSALQAKWETEFGNARSAYNAELGLQAPVTYWSAKRKHHSRRAESLARWLAWSFVAFFSAIAFAASILLDAELTKVTQIRLWQLTVLTVMILAAVWGLRIMVRLFFGNSHLENDAHERITIANTYLALLRRGKVSEVEQKALIEALMRHSADGIVQDDAMPQGVISLLRKP